MAKRKRRCPHCGALAKKHTLGEEFLGYGCSRGSAHCSSEVGPDFGKWMERRFDELEKEIKELNALLDASTKGIKV